MRHWRYDLFVMHCIGRAQMEALDAPAAPGERWWVAEVPVPLDAVVLDFVVYFYEHFDNNDGANHRALVTYDSTVAGCAAPPRAQQLRAEQLRSQNLRAYKLKTQGSAV